ncbi:pyruvate dehydrogenase E1 component beta subunit [Halopenitus malekzadehii]|uniref:Pyruvate dehydrogenase E1 component beta subunit n=1 Tax=Halopenitus malekzadehii TaxID=1267564 RepID=A0A1H6IUK8_9EURY|nr:alpha-ketoacid dehydrogenase subunit beta [Halopenitus malekzadehii]SEH50141.1 pyruvate dehydrogenase E1 component beta subunit [Halopenitus malekzadehii]
MKATIIEAINDALHEEMASDDRTVVFGEDVAESGGVFRATEGLLEEFGGDRVLDTPLSEIAIVGGAIGLAAHGYRPVAEIQFSGFLPPAFDQLVTNASRLRWRTRGEITAPMTVRTPYGAGVRALEHHSESLEASYGHLPGLKVAIPSTPADAKGMLTSAIRDPDPVLFMEPKHVYRSFREEVPEGEHTTPLGEAAVRREGSDVTVIAWGAMMHNTQEALADLPDVDAELIDLRSISPLDRETVVTSVKKTGRCVIVHEAAKSGGFAGELIATINDEALAYLEAPVRRVTGFDTPVPLLSMEDYYIPHPPRIEEAIVETVEY